MSKYIAARKITVDGKGKHTSVIEDGVFVRKGPKQDIFAPGDEVTGLTPAELKRLANLGAITKQKG